MNVNQTKLGEKPTEIQSLFEADPLKDLFRPGFSRIRVHQAQERPQAQNFQFFIPCISKKDVVSCTPFPLQTTKSDCPIFAGRHFLISWMLNFFRGSKSGLSLCAHVGPGQLPQLRRFGPRKAHFNRACVAVCVVTLRSLTVSGHIRLCRSVTHKRQ